MAKQTFSGISAKASAITGAVIGLLCWMFAISFSLSGYWMMGLPVGDGMIGYGYMGYMTGGVSHNATFGYMTNGVFHPYNGTAYYPGEIFHGYGLASAIVDVASGALAGLVIALVYDWALNLDKR